MICEYCGIEFEAKRNTARFCGNKCKLACRRDKVSVSNDRNKSVKDNSPNKLGLDPNLYYVGEITPEIEERLEKIYKDFNKRQVSGRLTKKVQCKPYSLRGKQYLTLWERRMLNGIEDETEEVEERELVFPAMGFSDKNLEKRIGDYFDFYNVDVVGICEGRVVPTVPSWIHLNKDGKFKYNSK